jgi:hypothetical protein
MFGFTFAFLGFSIVVIWSTLLETRSRLPGFVNGVYWGTSGLFAASLIVGAAARSLADPSDAQSMRALDNAPLAAQGSVALALIALTALTLHWRWTGSAEPLPDETSEAVDASEPQ